MGGPVHRVPGIIGLALPGHPAQGVVVRVGMHPAPVKAAVGAAHGPVQYIPVFPADAAAGLSGLTEPGRVGGTVGDTGAVSVELAGVTMGPRTSPDQVPDSVHVNCTASPLCIVRLDPMLCCNSKRVKY